MLWWGENCCALQKLSKRYACLSISTSVDLRNHTKSWQNEHQVRIYLLFAGPILYLHKRLLKYWMYWILASTSVTILAKQDTTFECRGQIKLLMTESAAKRLVTYLACASVAHIAAEGPIEEKRFSTKTAKHESFETFRWRNTQGL